MKERDDLDKFYNFVSDTLYSYQDQQFPEYFHNVYSEGDKQVYQKNISETKRFDDEWIKTVESYFPSIDRITKNPKSFIKYESSVVDIERAKKITSESVRHLASHSHLIKTIDKDENVIPKKILNITNEQDYEIYENRFIATLINRLYLFVKNRYDVIVKNVESFQKDHVNVVSKFNINNTEVEVGLDLLVKKDLDNKTINNYNHKLLDRVSELNSLIIGLKNSQFMKLMKNAKVVRPPIMKTNIILKSPDFRNAYNLWLFLDKYNTLGYDVEVKEKNLQFDDSFLDEIENLVLINYSTILGNQEKRKEIYNTPEGYREYIKKKTRVSRRNIKDDVANPEPIEMEENSLNEYFLNKYKSLFNESVNNETSNGTTQDIAIRRALRKTIEIVNGLYESVFHLEEDNDFFKRLVEKEDLDKEYEVKKNQLKYARIIREVKEVDYNRAIRQERRLMKELEDINRKLIKRNIDLENEEKNRLALEKLQSQVDAAKRENLEFENRLKELENINSAKELEQAKLRKEYMALLGRMKTMEAEMRKEEDEAIKEAFEKEKAMLEEKIAKEKERAWEGTIRLDELLMQKEREYIAVQKVKSYEEKKRIEEENRDRILEAERQIKEAEERQRIRIEDIEQLEREKIAIFKVNAYNERKRLEEKYRNRLIEEEKLREEETRKEKLRLLDLAQLEREKVAIQKVKDYENKKRLEEERRLKEIEEEKLRQERLEKEERLKEKERLRLLDLVQKERERIAVLKVKSYEEKLKMLNNQRLEKERLEKERIKKEALEEERIRLEQIQKEKEIKKMLELEQRNREETAVLKVKAYYEKLKAKKKA